ncbi:MAG: hypothetical protein Crog4KO_01490 [Crocinitomicaceae bacterium]
MANSEKKPRPIVPIPNSADVQKPIELFQSEVLRPILKVQHDILVATFHYTRRNFSDDWEELKKNKKSKLISDLILKNGPLKNTLIGIVVGQLEGDEIEEYLQDKKEYDRRITRMTIQRIQSTI